MSKLIVIAPPTEVSTMIAQTFDEVFSPQWVNTHLSHPTHDLIILRQLIPWQPILDGLVPELGQMTVVLPHLSCLVSKNCMANIRIWRR